MRHDYVIGFTFHVRVYKGTFMTGWTRILLCVTALVLGACAAGPRPGEMPKIDPQAQAVEAYRIGVDDVIRVAVWQNPDLNVTVPVRPDGRISVPLVGDVEAGGRTPEEVAAEITGKLETFVRNPQVTVIVDQLRSHEYLARVRVTGAVRTPISVPYRQGMTVLDAVLAAGGTNEFAAADRTELYRKQGESTRAYAVRLDRILQKGELDTNYPVQPGDVITVPERTF